MTPIPLRLSTLTLALACCLGLAACDDEFNSISRQAADSQRQMQAGGNLQSNQPVPTDISYSLERYNLIRRAYWVNGQRERARALPCPVANVPLGHIVLLAPSGAVVGKFVVAGKVSSLNSYLTPDSEYYAIVSQGYRTVKWLADVDGCYGKNDEGIFFFTPDGKYLEWSGQYLYSDIPMEVSDPVIRVAQPQPQPRN